MKSFSSTMRAWHRDLGYFVIGLTLIYAITGIILSGRGLGWLVKEYRQVAVMEKNISKEQFQKEFKKLILSGGVNEIFDESTYDIVKKRLSVRLTKQKDDKYLYRAFKSVRVQYESNSGKTIVKHKGYPIIVEDFVRAHKANHKSAWFYLAIIYSVILAFLAVSSFWMMKGKYGFRRRGVYFMLAGFVVVGVFLFI